MRLVNHQVDATEVVYRFHIIPEYWRGITERKTDFEYSEECAWLAYDDQEEVRIVRGQKCARIKSILEFLDFEYEDFCHAKWDFVDENSPQYEEYSKAIIRNTPNRIADHTKKHFAIPVYLSDDELFEPAQDIRNLIGYTCYKKSIDTKGE